MDIVYLVKPEKLNLELLYSLRSLKNIEHDRVFFVGNMPIGINKENIIYIPTEQNNTKYKNTTNNLLTACKDDRISENFIMMNDDFFIMKKINENDLNLNRGYMKDMIQCYINKYPQNTAYNEGAQDTLDLLKKMNIDNPLSFELHIPMIINKKNFIKMMSMPSVINIPVLHKRSLYGNLFMKNTITTEDVKIIDNYKIADKNCNFLSTMDSTFKRGKVGIYIRSIFNEKCKYEDKKVSIKSFPNGRFMIYY